MNPVSTIGTAFTVKNTVAKGVAEIGSTASATVPAAQPLAHAGAGVYDHEIAMQRLRASMRSNESAPVSGVVLGAALGGLLLAGFMASGSSRR